MATNSSFLSFSRFPVGVFGNGEQARPYASIRLRATGRSIDQSGKAVRPDGSLSVTRR